MSRKANEGRNCSERGRNFFFADSTFCVAIMSRGLFSVGRVEQFRVLCVVRRNVNSSTLASPMLEEGGGGGIKEAGDPHNLTN